MKRGEIWWADLPPPRGSEPGFRRPVVIVSDDRFNDSALRTVIVVALTTNLRLGDLPGNVSMPARGTGLSTASVANVTQVSTIDRHDLDTRIGRVPNRVMDSISHGLRLVLAL
jgi:mRNA interferase MazF